MDLAMHRILDDDGHKKKWRGIITGGWDLERLQVSIAYIPIFRQAFTQQFCLVLSRDATRPTLRSPHPVRLLNGLPLTKKVRSGSFLHLMDLQTLVCAVYLLKIRWHSIETE